MSEDVIRGLSAAVEQGNGEVYQQCFRDKEHSVRG